MYIQIWIETSFIVIVNVLIDDNWNDSSMIKKNSRPKFGLDDKPYAIKQLWYININVQFWSIQYMMMSSVVSKPGNHLGHINYTKIQINIATVRSLYCSKLIIFRYHVLKIDLYYFESFMSNWMIKWQGISKNILSLGFNF